MTWQTCIDFPGYEVSRDGQVRRVVHVSHASVPPGILKAAVDKDHGYPYLKLRDKDGVVRKVYIHRLIGKAFHNLTDDSHIDHRWHDPADHTSIRVATHTQNMRNARGWRNSSSRFKGVSWLAAKRKWYACIELDGRTKSLGRYESEQDAARAYDRAALAAWGEYAYLNFPAEAEAT
jgi:hypothetical protein